METIGFTGDSSDRSIRSLYLFPKEEAAQVLIHPPLFGVGISLLLAARGHTADGSKPLKFFDLAVIILYCVLIAISETVDHHPFTSAATLSSWCPILHI